MFELPDPTDCALTSITNRIEKHGDDDLPAVSFGLTFTTENTVLDLISATLRPALYVKSKGGQESLDGVEETTPHLRSPDMELVNVRGSYEGWTLNIDHGIDAHNPISFGGCKVDKFRVAPLEGGSVKLSLRVGTRDIDAERLGIVGMKIGQQISVTILKPIAKPDDKVTDGKPTLPGPWPFGDKGAENKPAALTPEKALADSLGVAQV
jgi:hypothetical protein